MAIALLVLWRMDYSSYNKCYIDKSTGKILRGIFAAIVVFHHIAHVTNGGRTFRGFVNIGFLAVAFFFFMSGYGLQKRYMSDENYEKGFLIKRLPALLIPYLIATVIYWASYVMCGYDYSIKTMLLSIISVDSMVANAWYVICIMAFYVFFYFAMIICRRRYKLIILCNSVFVVAWFCLCKYVLHTGIWWYNVTVAIVLGSVWAVYEKMINSEMEKYSGKFLKISGVVFIVMFMNLDLIYEMSYDMYIFMQCAVSIMFLFFILCLSSKVTIESKILSVLGEISYELYLIHGLWIWFFRQGVFSALNEKMYTFLVIVLSAISAYILHKLTTKIYRIYIKHVNAMKINKEKVFSK